MSDQKTEAPTDGATSGLALAPCSAWMSNREHDLIIALRQLCEATEQQCNANAGKESILVRMKRNNAKKMLAKYEPLSAPNTKMTNAESEAPSEKQSEAFGLAPCSALPPVLDACCGSRMFWFDRKDVRALFVDKRRETCAADSREGRREIVVDPDVITDFKALPFADATFTLVVFDPPHTFSGEKGWMAKKYGTLSGTDWREEIRAGFAECFRVLAPLGTLIFKWNEHRIPVSTVLSLTPERPLFGQRCGTTAKTHWVVFMKQNTKMSHGSAANT